jgi:hypothetical protein
MQIKKYLWHKTYMYRILGSVGTDMWRNFWVEDEKGNPVDLTKNGDLSCGLHVSGLLLNLNPRSGSDVKFVSGPILRVDQLHIDLVKNGWQEIEFSAESDLELGDIIFWEELRGYNGREAGGPHGHCGFYIGDEKVISVIPRTGNPQIHDYMYRDQQDYIGNFDGKKERKISIVLRNSELLGRLPQPEELIKTDIEA